MKVPLVFLCIAVFFMLLAITLGFKGPRAGASADERFGDYAGVWLLALLSLLSFVLSGASYIIWDIFFRFVP